MAEEIDFIIRIRGLPFSASVEEVISFFAMCRIANGREGVHITYSQEGRPSGEAFVELESEKDLENALKKNNDHMGKRYIEVFKSNRSEMNWVVERQGPQGGGTPGSDGVLRCRGLPFGTIDAQVREFFSDYEIVEGGVVIPTDAMGRPGGEAYVQFASQAQADLAMGKDKEKMGHRYIELFKSSSAELRTAASGGMRRGAPRGGMRPSPYDRGDRFGMGMGGGYGGRPGPMKGADMGGWGGYGGYGGGFGNYPGMNSTTGHSVHMRGLPFRATESEIMTFFNPLVPSAIHVHYEASGRATGEADVEFEDHASAQKAMEKDKQHMGSRYVELFLQSQAPNPYEGVGGPIAQNGSMLGKFGSNGAGGGPMRGRGGMGGGMGAARGGYGAESDLYTVRGGMIGPKMPSGRGGAGAYGGDYSSVAPSYGGGDGGYGGW